MGNLSKDVKNSVVQGEEFANKTALAMDEINIKLKFSIEQVGQLKQEIKTLETENIKHRTIIMRLEEEQKKFIENLQKGEKIVTIAGIHGKISQINEDGTYVCSNNKYTLRIQRVD